MSARRRGVTSIARDVAYERLLRFEAAGSVAGVDPDTSQNLDPREHRQAVDYVAGVTRWRRRLDFILRRYYSGDFDRMEPSLKLVLRIGLYDLLFLDTPEYAAVNEAVALAKRRVRRSAGGLVNGILRSVLRDRPLPSPNTGDPAEDMAIEHSHPTWMVRRWLDRYGKAAATRLLEWNNMRPSYGVRINTLKTEVDAFLSRLDALGVEWTRGTYLPYFVTVDRLQPLVRHGIIADGWCAVQDESAGLIVRLLDPEPGDVVVDVCAAPGGKALHAAQAMKNTGRLIAVDINVERLRLIDIAAEQQGVRILETIPGDARTFANVPAEGADRVLIDAPCSGLGVLSKRADIRWNRTPDDLAVLTDLQDAILDGAARLVRPGGVLVYGTCTIEPEENEHRVGAFLERHDDFKMDDARTFLPDDLVTADGFYATHPPRHHVDGAFAARLAKRK